MELVQLRHRAVCSVCGSKLPPRSEAWYDEESREAVCPTCHRVQQAARSESEGGNGVSGRPPVPDLNRAPRLVRARPSGDDPIRQEVTSEVESALADRAVAALRQAEADRMDQELAAKAELTRDKQAREMIEAATDNRPRPERSEARLTPPLPAPEPPTKGSGPTWLRTRLPRVGPSLNAAAEAKKEIAANEPGPGSISRALEAARPHGLEIIASRPWVGTRVESEAIVVGPSGIWVVGGLGDSDKPLEKGFLGGHSGSELLNVVGGRTSIITGLLFDSPYQRTPVRGALCFEGPVPSWFEDQFTLAGITITTPRDLIDSLFTPLHLDAETRRKVAQHLVSRF